MSSSPPFVDPDADIVAGVTVSLVKVRLAGLRARIDELRNAFVERHVGVLAAEKNARDSEVSANAWEKTVKHVEMQRNAFEAEMKTARREFIDMRQRCLDAESRLNGLLSSPSGFFIKDGGIVNMEPQQHCPKISPREAAWSQLKQHASPRPEDIVNAIEAYVSVCLPDIKAFA